MSTNQALQGYECNYKHKANKQYWFATSDELDKHVLAYHSWNMEEDNER